MEGTVVIIYHHARCIDARTDAVVEHQAATVADEPIEVVVLRRVLGLRHYDAAYAMLHEALAYLHLALIALIALCHQQAVSVTVSLRLDAREDGGEIEMHYLGHYDTYHLRWLHVRLAQARRQRVRRETLALSVGHHPFAHLCRDYGRAAESPRHRGDRHSKVACKVLHRKWFVVW